MFSQLIRGEKTTGGVLKIALVFLMVGTMVAGLPGASSAFASAIPQAEATIAVLAAEQPTIPVPEVPFDPTAHLKWVIIGGIAFAVVGVGLGIILLRMFRGGSNR